MQAQPPESPETAPRCAFAPYRSAMVAEPPVAPSRRARLMPVATFALAALTAGTSVATLALANAAMGCRSFLAASRASHATPTRFETTLDVAVDQLARANRQPLFVAPGVDLRTLRQPIPLSASAGEGADAVRALDAYAASHGLWLHVAEGVMRLETAVTSVDLRCDDTLEACATRLERVASVTVVRDSTRWMRPVHLVARRGEPALEAMRASVAAAGFSVDVVGRTLYVSGAPTATPTVDEVRDTTVAPSMIRALGRGRYVLSSTTLQRLIEGPQTLMRSARIFPEVVQGRTVGVRVGGIAPDSVLTALGLQNGDVLQRVNGFDVTSPDRCLEAYATVRQQDRLVLQLQRGGRLTLLEYIIVPG